MESNHKMQCPRSFYIPLCASNKLPDRAVLAYDHAALSIPVYLAISVLAMISCHSLNYVTSDLAAQARPTMYCILLVIIRLLWRGLG